jgi:alpha-1,3-glucosyltransferase
VAAFCFGGIPKHATPSFIVFQRLTVIASDVAYVFAVHYVYQNVCSKRSALREFLISMPFGLVLIDSINIQIYLNRYPLPIQWNVESTFDYQLHEALAGIREITTLKHKHIQSAVLFSILLCLKHIYIYVAPIFFFHILMGYCTTWKNLLKMALTCVGVVLVVFLPFLG